jgi:hypothetical protein
LSFPLLLSQTNGSLDTTQVASAYDLPDFATCYNPDAPPMTIVLSIVQSLRDISKVAAVHLQSASPDKSQHRFLSNAIYEIEHIMLSISPQRLPESWSEYALDMTEFLRLACLLYQHLAIRDLPITARRHHSILRRMRASFPSSFDQHVPFMAHSTLQLLLWSFFVGSIVVAPANLASFFIENLQRVCSIMGVDTYESFYWNIEQMPFLEPFCAPHSVAVWERLQGSSDGSKRQVEVRHIQQRFWSNGDAAWPSIVE